MKTFFLDLKESFTKPFRDIKSLWILFTLILIISALLWLFMWISLKYYWENFSNVFYVLCILLCVYLISVSNIFLVSIFCKNLYQSKTSTLIFFAKSLKKFCTYFCTVSIAAMPYIIIVVVVTIFASKIDFVQEVIYSDPQGALILAPIAILLLFVLWFFFIPLILLTSTVNVTEEKKYFICLVRAFYLYKKHWFLLWVYSWLLIIISGVVAYLPIFWWFLWTVFFISTFFHYYFHISPKK